MTCAGLTLSEVTVNAYIWLYKEEFNDDTVLDPMFDVVNEIWGRPNRLFSLRCHSLHLKNLHLHCFLKFFFCHRAHLLVPRSHCPHCDFVQSWPLNLSLAARLQVASYPWRGMLRPLSERHPLTILTQTSIATTWFAVMITLSKPRRIKMAITSRPSGRWSFKGPLPLSLVTSDALPI